MTNRVITYTLAALVGGTAPACVPEGKDLPNSERWAFSSDRSRSYGQRQRTEPVIPGQVCDRDADGKQVVYTFDENYWQHPMMLTAATEADVAPLENLLNEILIRLQGDLRRSFAPRDMARVINLMSNADGNVEPGDLKPFEGFLIGSETAEQNYQRLRERADRMLGNRNHVGLPVNSRQNIARMYRDDRNAMRGRRQQGGYL